MAPPSSFEILNYNRDLEAPYGLVQTKLWASSMLPVPLYFAVWG